MERLEEQVIPEDELKVWQIVITDSDGTKTLGERLNGLRGPVVGKYQRRRSRGGDFAKYFRRPY